MSHEYAWILRAARGQDQVRRISGRPSTSGLLYTLCGKKLPCKNVFKSYAYHLIHTRARFFHSIARCSTPTRVLFEQSVAMRDTSRELPPTALKVSHHL